METPKERKLKGKQAEPTSEELEFIYGLVPLLSDKEIVMQMQEETQFPPRTTGFIKRRRTELKAAEKVLGEQVKKEFDPVLVKQREKHWNKLAEQANIYWSIIKKATPPVEDIDDKKTISELLEETDSWDKGVGEDEFPFAELLLAHLKNEFPELASLKYFQELTVEQFRKFVRPVALGRTFKGTCDICKGWE